MMNEPNVNLDHLMHEMDFRTSDKVCPMMMSSVAVLGQCLGHGCAWWNSHYGGCAIGTAYLTLDYVGHQISRIGDELMQKKEA